jgi:pimeloyl-ACP methyl ester carboxylesterase
MWFGPPERPRMGWLHLPADGHARAGVVLCPPLGYEESSSHRTFLVLAQDLASAGLAALRLDYDGTGDSAGSGDDGERVQSWIASVADAVNALREVGTSEVAVVGMRIGAMLAALAAESSDIGPLVLWDPVWSGRTFVRQLRALQRLGSSFRDESDDGSVEAAGVTYAPATVAELASLGIGNLEQLRGPILVLTRPDHKVPDVAAALPPGSDRMEALGQAELLDCDSTEARVPTGTVDTVVAWLDAHLTGPPRACTAPHSGTARVADGVTERVARLGPLGLLAVVTEPDLVGASPTLVLLNNATGHHIGPARLWVDWSRRMAARGFRVARVDLSGIGESPVRAGQVVDRPYAPETTDDIAAIATALDGEVVLIGMCSGARNAIDAAATVVPAAGVCAINVHLHIPRDVIAEITNDDPLPPGVLAYNRYRRLRHHLLIRVPMPVWWVLDRTRIVPNRVRLFERLQDRGVDTLAVFGAEEFGLFKLNETSRWALRRLESRPRFRLEVIDDLDHGLLARTPRQALEAVLTEHLVSRWPPGVNPSASTAPAPTRSA